MTTIPASYGSASNPGRRFAKNGRPAVGLAKRAQAASSSASVAGSAPRAAIARSAPLAWMIPDQSRLSSRTTRRTSLMASPSSFLVSCPEPGGIGLKLFVPLEQFPDLREMVEIDVVGLQGPFVRRLGLRADQ